MQNVFKFHLQQGRQCLDFIEKKMELPQTNKQPKQWHWKNCSLLVTFYESEAHMNYCQHFQVIDWILSHQGKQLKQWHWKNSSLLLTFYESEAYTKDFHHVGFFHTNMLRKHQNFSFPVAKRSPNTSRHRFSLGAPSTLNFNTPSRGSKYFDFFTLEGPHTKEDSQSYYIDYL